MTTESATIVQRLWNYCNVLRDDGVSYGDYVEQLTYLLFLKMDDEGARLPGRASAIPEEYNWASLRRLEGLELEHHYRDYGQAVSLVEWALEREEDEVARRALDHRLRRLRRKLVGTSGTG